MDSAREQASVGRTITTGHYLDEEGRVVAALLFGETMYSFTPDQLDILVNELIKLRRVIRTELARLN